MSRIPIELILYTVSRRTGIDQAIARERHRREPKIVRYRQIVTVLARQHSRMSFEAIAEAVGGTRTRHNTYSRAFARGMNDPETLAAVEEIGAELLNTRSGGCA